MPDSPLTQKMSYAHRAQRLTYSPYKRPCGKGKYRSMDSTRIGIKVDGIH
jgi:hypothetical protein